MEKTFRRLTKSKESRRGYVDAEVCNSLAAQIRTLRLQRNLKQSELAKQLGTTQAVISRLENPAYGKVGLKTLLALSGVFDVALSVRFVSFSRFFVSTWNPDIDALKVHSFEEEMEQLPEAPPQYTSTGNQPVLTLRSGTRGSFSAMRVVAASEMQGVQIG
jgi:transcriptional regulator with XRE-family HTH domain